MKEKGRVAEGGDAGDGSEDEHGRWRNGEIRKRRLEEGKRDAQYNRMGNGN